MKWVVQIKSNWEGDDWQTVDYFDDKPSADAFAANIRTKNTGDIKTDNHVRVVHKRISMIDRESAASEERFTD